MKSGAGEHERDREPERVDGEQRRALRATVSDEPASTRIAASTGPMHGAAHTANAPPSSTREPRPRAPCDEPGADEPLGPRQEAHEREPEHDEHEARDLLEQELVAEEAAADAAPRRRRAATKTAVKPRTNGMLAMTTRRAVPGSPSRSALDRRDGREVAGHERQHARREERDEARRANATGIDSLGRSLRRTACELRRRRAARARGSRRSRRLAVVVAARRADGSTPTRRSPTPSAPATSSAERQQPGEQVEAALRRLGEHARPELVDERRP